MGSSDLEVLWQAYLDAEELSARSMYLGALDCFIDTWCAQKGSEREDWVYSLVRQVVDFEEAIPIRFPLFRRVLLPVLCRAVEARVAGAARWLAYFGEHLMRCGEDTERLVGRTWTTTALLEEALEVDAEDALARQRLVALRAEYLRYTLHELPSGVIYGPDGATEEECRELLGLLEDFEENVSILKLTSKYHALLAECKKHFHCYRAYLLDAPQGQSYSTFLEASGCSRPVDEWGE